MSPCLAPRVGTVPTRFPLQWEPQSLVPHRVASRFPRFPLSATSAWGRARVRARYNEQHSGNCGNSGNQSTYTYTLHGFMWFPLCSIEWEPVGTNGNLWATYGQPSHRKSLSYLSLAIPPCPPVPPCPARATQARSGGQLSLPRPAIRRSATPQPFGCATNVQVCAPASSPKHSHNSDLQPIVISPVIAMGPSRPPPPIAGSSAGGAIYLYVLWYQVVVHVMGACRFDAKGVLPDVA